MGSDYLEDRENWTGGSAWMYFCVWGLLVPFYGGER